VLKDVSIRLAPVDRNQAMEMISDLSGAVLLESYRGLKPADTALVAKALVRISQLIDRFPEIREVEINPILLCDQDGAGVAVDARVLLEMKHDENPVL
jgi:acyl-CoA synthetase (NDP forming)